MRTGRVGLVTMVIAVLVTATATAMSPAMGGTKAKRDAAKQLAAVRFPRGARAVSRDPSVGSLRPPWSKLCLRQYTAWDHGFWRVPGAPSSVWNWIRHHPPLHAGGVDSTVSGPAGRPVIWGISVPFKGQPGVEGRAVDISIAAARGGGTAVRVDSTAVRIPPPHLKPCAVGSY
jgi:hypothetical protein